VWEKNVDFHRQQHPHFTDLKSAHPHFTPGRLHVILAGWQRCQLYCSLHT